MVNHTSKILVIGLTFLLLGAGVVLGSKTIVKPQTLGAWSENFDSYATGSALNGQGGWFGWDGVAGATGYVVSDQALSTPNAEQTQYNSGTASDMVHTYDGVDSGVWIYTAYSYVPSVMTGNQYFILLNTYQNGTHNNPDWSLQLQYTANPPVITDYNDPTITATVLTDQWVQIRVEIDFDADIQNIFYNGVNIGSGSWRDHVSPGGAANLAAVDLYAGDAPGSTAGYWDDLSVAQPSAVVAEAGGPYSGTIGTPIQFSGSATGGSEPYTWSWAFGDGATATEQNPTHTYATSGNFTAILTVTDSTGASGVDTASVSVAGPVIEITKIAGGKGVTATVANTGTIDATGVDWTIALSGGFLLKGKTLSGTIDSLAAGTDTTITSGVLGFGKTTITVTAGDATKTASGFVFLFFVLGVK